MHQHSAKGDWKRDRVIRVKIKRCSIVWSCENGTVFIIKTPVPSGIWFSCQNPNSLWKKLDITSKLSEGVL